MGVILTPRLKAIVDQVLPCETAIDVGCDHAQVGIYLAENKVSHVTVSDINEGPIMRAKKAIEEAGLTDKITCVKCDGLEGISKQDTVIIAGMGGELIRDIIAKAEWTKTDCRLILQPMSMGNVLREFLFKNGYEIIKETIACEKERVYTIITATGGRCTFWGEADLYLYDLSDPCANLYLNKIILRLERALNGLKAAETANEIEIKRHEELIDVLKARRDRR